MSEYLLTIRVKMEAVDNMEAREKAKGELARLGMVDSATGKVLLNGEEVKLQMLVAGKAPEKVEM
jgi:hypothetical protein